MILHFLSMPGRAAPAALLASLLLFACSRTDSPVITAFGGSTMGTKYSVKLVGVADEAERDRLASEVRSILQAVDRHMSTWRNDSELSALNQAPVGEWLPLSPSMLQVLRLALTVSRQTEGSFDITVGPLVNLWGFGPGPGTDTLPEPAEIERAMSRVGYRLIRLDEAAALLRKDAAVLLDLSAIAKGYAVDRIASYLDREGYSNYLVEVGGEIRARGGKPSDGVWKIAIESPLDHARRVQRVIALNDAGLATSGDYRNFFVIDGQRYSHTIDPASGRPVTHSLASVTVVDEQAAAADALATALLVMGPETAYRFAVEHGLGAFFIYRENGAFRERFTPAFARLLPGDAVAAAGAEKAVAGKN